MWAGFPSGQTSCHKAGLSACRGGLENGRCPLKDAITPTPVRVAREADPREENLFGGKPLRPHVPVRRRCGGVVAPTPSVHHQRTQENGGRE